MPESRLTKKIFNYDYRGCIAGSWASRVKNILSDIDSENKFDRKLDMDLDILKARLVQNYEIDWKEEIKTKPKLRTFCTFKTEFGTEKYLTFNLERYERSLLAQLRIGILPLHIETGRYVGTPPQDRVCLLCNNNQVEDENHFLFDCKLYDEFRSKLVDHVKLENPDFNNHPTDVKWKILFNYYTVKLAHFVKAAFMKRKQTIYRT